MNILRYISLGLVAAAVAGCQTGGTPSSAPIVDKRPATAKQPEPSRPKIVAPKGHYVVQRGDTLFRISQEVGQSMSDLVTWNNLANPNDIKVDQVLRVVPPETPPRTQTGSVTTTPEVEVRPSGTPPATTTPSTPSSPPPATAPGKTDTAAKGSSRPPASQTRNVVDGVSWVWPTDGAILQPYSPSRKGISIGGKMGQPIVAAGAGTVLYASSVRGYGNLVIIKHTNTLLSAYAHNKTILVKEGQTVTQGQKIAEMGDSDTDRVKLHFEIRQQGKPVDPTKYLPNR